MSDYFPVFQVSQILMILTGAEIPFMPDPTQLLSSEKITNKAGYST